MDEALKRIDQTVETLFLGLKERGLEGCVNIMIVSDHGMATTDFDKVVNLTKVSSVKCNASPLLSQTLHRV